MACIKHYNMAIDAATLKIAVESLVGALVLLLLWQQPPVLPLALGVTTLVWLTGGYR